MATLGRWTGGSITFGNLPETWTAPNGLFPTQDRNDGSAYTFTSSTSTLTLPSSGLADGYLMIGYYEYFDNGARFNPQGQIVQTGGTGTVINPPGGGYLRDASEDTSYTLCWCFVDGPSASATFQFQWKADADDADASDGTIRSHFTVIPLYYADVGLYSSADHTTLGGTTFTTIPGWSGTDGTNITISANVVSVTGDNKRYLVLAGSFNEGRGGRTQRNYGLAIDGTHEPAAQSYAYFRNTSNDETGGNIFYLLETATATKTIQLQMRRGPSAITAGGADIDGSDPGVGDHGLVVLELNDSAEVFQSHDETGGQRISTSTPVDYNIARATDIQFNDAASFTRASDTAVNVEVATDVLAFANIWAARTGGVSGSDGLRQTSRAEITKNGTEEQYVRHGNYMRGEQSTTDTWGWGANPIGFVACALNDDLGLSVTSHAGSEGINNGTNADETLAGSVGFGLINLDTLEAAAETNDISSTLQGVTSSLSGTAQGPPVTGTQTSTIAQGADVYGSRPVYETDDELAPASRQDMVFNKPTGTAEDDLLVAICHGDTTQTMTPPAGFTELYDETVGPGNNEICVAYKVAGASEPSTYTFSWATSATQCCGVLARISGVETSDPIDIETKSEGTGDPIDAPSVTTTVGNTLLLRYLAINNSTLTTIPGTNVAELELAGSPNFGMGTQNGPDNPGSTGTAQFDVSGSEEYFVGTIAISPTVTPGAGITASLSGTSGGPATINGNLNSTLPFVSSVLQGRVSSGDISSTLAGGVGVPAFETDQGASASTAVTQLACNKPSGTVSGDVLVAIVTVYGGDVSSTGITSTGWTGAHNCQYETDGSESQSVRTLYKLAGGSEPSSYTFSHDGTAQEMIVRIFRLSGVSASVDVVATGTSLNTDNPTAPAITTVAADTIELRLYSYDEETISDIDSIMSGFTGIEPPQNNNTGQIAAAYRVNTSAGDKGAQTWTDLGLFADDWAVISIAFPAAPAGISASLVGDVGAAVGTLGDIASTLGTLTSSLSGTHTPPPAVTSTMSSTLAGVTSNLSGTHTPPPAVTGTQTSTIGTLTSALNGTHVPQAVTGTQTSTIGTLSSSLAGELTVSGDISSSISVPGTPGSTGLTLAGTGSDQGGGDNPWSDVSNVTSSDDNYAFSDNNAAGETTNILHVTNFGLSVPAGATIDGIIVRVERRRTAGGGDNRDLTVQLIKGGTAQGDNNADTITNWEASDTLKDYGGASDLWNLTLTDTDVNATNFGVALQAESQTGGTASTFNYDAVWINCHYTGAGAGISASLVGTTSLEATLDAMLAGTTSSLSGTVQAAAGITGTVSVNLSPLTSNLNGTHVAPPAVTGTQTSTLGTLTASASGTVTPPVPTTGDASSSLSTLASSLAGTSTAPGAVTGTQSSSLLLLTSTLNGTHTLPPAVTATQTSTLSTLTSALSGIVTPPAAVTGTQSSTLVTATSNLSGTVSAAPAVSGDIAATLAGPIASSLAGTLTVSGDVAANLIALQSALSGEALNPVSGNVSSTLITLTSSLAGTAEVLTNDINSVIGGPTSVLAGTVSVLGDFVASLGAPQSSLQGTVSVLADIDASLGQLSASLAGELTISGSVDSTLIPLTSNLSGTTPIFITADFSAQLSGVTFSGSGELSITSDIASTLLPLTFSGTGLALEDITADLASTLATITGAFSGIVAIKVGAPSRRTCVVAALEDKMTAAAGFAQPGGVRIKTASEDREAEPEEDREKVS